MKEIPYLAKVYSQVLQEARERARLSQRELAERAGCARSFVSFMETGAHMSRLNVFVALADTLGVSPGEMMRKVDARRKLLVDRES